MEPDRFTITIKKLDFMKLKEKIYTYELKNGYSPYLFMSSDTINELINILGLSANELSGASPSGYCGTYCGRKTFCDNSLNYGEVEIR